MKRVLAIHWMVPVKRIVYSLLLYTISMSCYAQQDEAFDGAKLYGDVKQYVSFGVHRTGTEGDLKTSAWIKSRLDAKGFKTEYTTFPVKQFFIKDVRINVDAKSITAFPLWPVQQAESSVKGVLVDPLFGDFELYTNKVVLVRLPPGGQINQQIIRTLEPVIAAGAIGIVAIAKNDIGDIVAYNTTEELQPWKIPVVIISPQDSLTFIQAACSRRQVSIQVKGTLKEIQARSVTGKIGSGSKYIVISTPVSGWFTCGGERGPGIAIFNALADWASKQKTEYTFVFTANTGHELDNKGAHIFINQFAPKPEDVYLWLHLGAGIATVDWKTDEHGFTKLATADGKRNIMYSENLEQTIHQAFKDLPAKRWKVKDQALGELGVVAAHGYRRFFGIAYGHPLHHMPSDDASTTNPEILQQAALAIKKALEIELTERIVKTY